MEKKTHEWYFFFSFFLLHSKNLNTQGKCVRAHKMSPVFLHSTFNVATRLSLLNVRALEYTVRNARTSDWLCFKDVHVQIWIEKFEIGNNAFRCGERVRECLLALKIAL